MGKISKNITHLELISKMNKNIQTISCGNSLYVRKLKDGYHWYYRDEKRNFKYLNSCKKMVLSQARALLKDLENKDKKIKKEVLFEDLFKEWIDIHKVDLKLKYKITCINRAFSSLNKVPINQITNKDIKDLLLKTPNFTPYLIKYTLNIFCNIFDLAIENEYISSHNFFLLKKTHSFPKYVKSIDGYKFKPIDYFYKIFSTLQYLDYYHVTYYLMLSLTCLRRNECINLKYEYFDLENDVINLPGSLMKVKNKKYFRIPLTKQMKNIFYFLQNHNDSNSEYLFINPKTKKKLDKNILSNIFSNLNDHQVTLHGFRKTARTWFSENQINLEVAAKCLDHSLPLGADVFYQKSDLLEQRRDVMSRYNDEIQKNLPDFCLKYIC